DYLSPLDPDEEAEIRARRQYAFTPKIAVPGSDVDLEKEFSESEEKKPSQQDVDLPPSHAPQPNPEAEVLLSDDIPDLESGSVYVTIEKQKPPEEQKPPEVQPKH